MHKYNIAKRKMFSDIRVGIIINIIFTQSSISIVLIIVLDIIYYIPIPTYNIKYQVFYANNNNLFIV